LKDKKDLNIPDPNRMSSKADLDSFSQLEQEFQEVLHELKGDKSLEKFKIEYEKLYKALIKSHESEKRLMHKCRELNAELVANSAKVQTALKLGQEDQNTISTLKKVKIFKHTINRY
jgi:DNA repair exonuclease SbcCD ATPase subunit